MKDIIAWWSGGATSAVACKKAIEIYGLNRVRVIMIDTRNEHPDTYRFKKDCEKWFGLEIESIHGFGEKYNSIWDVWRDFESLNTATGAICSTTLKRLVRKKWQKENEYSHQVFGYEFDKKEMNRALAMSDHNSDSNPIYPLLMFGIDKIDCFNIIESAGIQIPVPYELGFNNNNCFQTGCVQGGIGYWQKMKKDFPEKFKAMGEFEHELSNLRGEPVTMLKDQSNSAKESFKKDKKSHLVFLIKNPNYPHLKCIDEMPECEVKPLKECNGFCGTNLYNERNPTKAELNFE